MKTIHIITLQNIANYGSVLQALATQELFKTLGLNVKFYNYKRKETLSIFSKIRYFIKVQGVKGLFKSFLWIPSWIKEGFVFSKFLSKHINTIPQVVCESRDFKKLNLDADIYCTGSDQTWNSGWNNGILPPLFLDFAPADKPRIAYAASFGKTSLDEEEKKCTEELLSKYSFISVRENSAVDICGSLGIEAFQVVDPTLQMTADYWRTISKPVKYKGYCLLYQLNSSKAFDKFAVDFCKQKGLMLIRFCHRLDKLFLPADVHLPMPQVEDFISYIDHADFVLTDSFHCSAFASNLNKQFLSFYPEYGGRIKSLLDLLHLENRHIADLNAVEEYVNMGNIDFTEANAILNQERKKTIKLLKDVVR
jgi:hypothetical protein